MLPKDLRHRYRVVATAQRYVSLQTRDRQEARVRGMARRATVEGEFRRSARAWRRLRYGQLPPCVRSSSMRSTPLVQDAFAVGNLGV